MKISDNRNNCKVVVSYVETQSEINMKFNHSWASLVAQHKESAYNEGDLGLIPGLGRSPEKRKATHTSIWPGEFHQLYSPWSNKESDTTEQPSHFDHSL